MNKLIYLLNLCELIAVISGLVHWKKIKGSYWKWFAVYLVIILVVELTGKYLKYTYPHTNLNAYLYSFLGLPVQFLFFFWLFKKQFDSKALHVLSISSTLIYITACIVESVYLKGIATWFFSFSYTVGNLLLVILLVVYLLKFINSDEILNFKSNMMFWVAIGIAIFYLGTLPFFALRNTLYYQYRDVFTVYNYIQLILDCLMYIVFALSFIWGKPK